MGARTVEVTLSEDLYDLVERVGAAENRTPSDVIGDAVRAHLAHEYTPDDHEREALRLGVEAARTAPDALSDWADVRHGLQSRG